MFGRSVSVAHRVPARPLVSVRSAVAVSGLAVALTLAGCAGAVGGAAEPDAGRRTSVATDCFTVSLARDFRYLDERNLIVYAPARRAYHVELSQVCMGLRGQIRLALRSRTDRMCGFAGDAVIGNGAFAERCPVLAVRQLDEDQLQVLIRQFEPDAASEPEFEVVIPEGED